MAEGGEGVQVDEAHSLIGKNAPRYLESKGYLVKISNHAGDYYKLTASGESWLIRGIESYLKNHPSERSSVALLLGQPVTSRVIRRRR